MSDNMKDPTHPGPIDVRTAEIQRLLAALAAEQARAERAEAALRAVKIRLHFDGWPGETMWNAGTDESPRWVADWRHEISLIENALHGTPITTPDNLSDTRKRCELPALALRPSCDGVQT